MDTRKKVLILYASAGHGHEKAARAVYEALEGAGDCEVKILDALSLTSRCVGPLYRWIYFVQIRHLPWLWGFFYYVSDVRGVYFFLRFLRRFLNGPLASRLHRFITDEGADVIVSTHFLSTEIASHLKRRNKIRSKLLTVVTDYLPHWVWTAPAVDGYAVAAEETRRSLEERGVPAGKIWVTGIPVERKFFARHARAELLEKFALLEGCFTVLITSGGAGLGAAGEVAERLSRSPSSVQVLIVCGTNKTLFERMSVVSAANPRLKVFGFVDNMDELMEVADVVVGKGGGLTITEGLAKGKPLMLFRSVPGQERRNDRVVEHYGAGFATDSVERVAEKVRELASDQDALFGMREGVRRLARPRASARIAELIRHEL